MAFVALLGGELVAVARYEKVTGGDRPEIAFFVDDRHHGRGLATILLEYLAAAARSRGLTGFTATVLAENYAMLGVFKKAGFGVKTWFDDGHIGVDLSIEVTAETSDAIARRHSRARSRSVARLLAPTTVALVGASRRRGSVGNELLSNLIDGGFTGEIFPVNRAADEVLGRRAWASLSAIGQPVDLVIVAVPADEVEQVVLEAADLGVSGLLVISSGFSESGSEGEALERRLVSVARSNGMRLIGPNSFGLVNTAPATRLRALFLAVGPDVGSVAMLSQSGPLGGAVLEHMRANRIGISSFVAVGTRADVSVNDVLDYWLTDDATHVVLLYVENYGNLRNFARTARSLSAHKPIVSVRPPEENLVELLGQSGVVLVEGVAEMAQVARMAAHQPLPKGRRVVVVSNTASVARLAASACRRFGLDVIVPESINQTPWGRTRAADTVLVGDVDTILVAGSDDQPDYERVLVAAAVSADVDAVLVALVPTLDLTIDGLATLLDNVNRSIDKPVAATGLVGEDRLSVPGLPVFEFPEEAARTLGHLAAYAHWRHLNPEDPEPIDDALVAEIDGAVGTFLPSEGSVTLDLLSPELPELLAALGLSIAPWRLVSSIDELEAAADAVGYPVVLKAGLAEQRTVGEAGGAAIDLHEQSQLEGAFSRMLTLQGPSMLPAVVQEMVASSANVKIELVQDPELGAFICAGLGGALASAGSTSVRRFLPLVGGEAAEMVVSLEQMVPMGEATRTVLVELITRLASVAFAVPELSHVDLDPVLIAGSATVAADVKVTLVPRQSDPLAGVRRL